MRCTAVCFFWLGCIFLYMGSRCDLHIHTLSLLIRSTLTFLLFYKKRFQPLSGMACICICCFSIFHVFPFADILPEAAFFPFLISLWFYICFLLLFPQICINFLAFIPCIGSYTRITVAQIFLHCFQERYQRPYVISLLKDICYNNVFAVYTNLHIISRLQLYLYAYGCPPYA